jgi:hypothetical protein
VNFTLSTCAVHSIFVDKVNFSPSYTVSDMTVIGCTLSIVNQSAFIDSKTKRLVSVEPIVTKTSSEWVPWTIKTNPIPSFDTQIDSVSNTEDKYISADISPMSSGHQYLM